MGMWKRAADALKDGNRLMAATFLSRRTAGLDVAVIKATSHDNVCFDSKNARRVYAWVRTSPLNLTPVLLAISARVDRTRSWPVVLKALMLTHGVLRSEILAIEQIGRLPFDLSNFSDAHSRPSRVWGFNAFVRAYYSFLDQRSAIAADLSRKLQKKHDSVSDELFRIQNLQSLMDLLMQIKPMNDDMRTPLILEALDCVIVEIFDIYSKICSGIAKLLLNVYQSAGKINATMALNVVEKAMAQGDQLTLFFTLCREFSVPNAREIPQFVKIPDRDLQALKRIISGVADEKCYTKKTIDKERWKVSDSNPKKSRFAPCQDSLPPLIEFDEPVHSGNNCEVPDLISL